MTVESVAQHNVNPTVFLVTDPKDPRLYKPNLIENGIYSMLAKWLESGRPLYGTYFRNDDSFWEEEVFVCPKCVHASPIDFCANEEKTAMHCKYCSTDWVIKDGRIMMNWPRFDDDGNMIDEVLI